eukprot:TRINITY_DN4260_c0_g1_i1.p1 TRINITY_DN4260_c0_g1~~TRINITY_DN4260_c0_g1_i1.p1  ORF type:complete len:633 (-),score=190.44 TRINITY_DN4260_c0_g1_i1:208-2106(-)
MGFPKHLRKKKLKTKTQNEEMEGEDQAEPASIDLTSGSMIENKEDRNSIIEQDDFIAFGKFDDDEEEEEMKEEVIEKRSDQKDKRGFKRKQGELEELNAQLYLDETKIDLSTIPKVTSTQTDALRRTKAIRDHLVADYRRIIKRFIDFTFYDEATIAKQMAPLNASIKQWYSNVRPSPTEINNREQFRRNFEEKLHEWTGDDSLSLFIFGSTLSGTFFADADIDLVLVRWHRWDSVDGPDRSSKVDCLRKLGDWARQSLGLRFRMIPGAATPLIQTDYPQIKKGFPFPFDMCVDAPSGVFTSSLIAAYNQLDWRVTPLTLVLKNWIHSTSVADKFTGLTSFPLYLLIIFFLQNRPVPILPNIQLENSKASENWKIGKMNCFFEKPENWKSKNSESLGSLLYFFFHFYATFDFPKNVISIRLGKSYPVAEGEGHFLDPHLMNVENPLDPGHNVTSRIRELSYLHFRLHLKKACILLRSTPDLSAIISVKSVKKKDPKDVIPPEQISPLIGIDMVPTIIECLHNAIDKFQLQDEIQDENQSTSQRRSRRPIVKKIIKTNKVGGTPKSALVSDPAKSSKPPVKNVKTPVKSVKPPVKNVKASENVKTPTVKKAVPAKVQKDPKSPGKHAAKKSKK